MSDQPTKKKDPLDEPMDLLAPDDAPEPVEPEGEGSALDESELLGAEDDGPLPDEDEGLGTSFEDDPLLSPDAAVEADGWDEVDRGGSAWDDDGLLQGDLGHDDEWTDPGPVFQPFVEEDTDAFVQKDEAWSDLEDEGRALPKGRIVVGLKDFVQVRALGLVDVGAVFDTSAERSMLRGRSRLTDDGMQVALGPYWVSVDTGSGTPSATLAIEIGPMQRELVFDVLFDEPTDTPFVLGRDALEGHFVVDVALRYLHPKSARSIG